MIRNCHSYMIDGGVFGYFRMGDGLILSVLVCVGGVFS